MKTIHQKELAHASTVSHEKRYHVHLLHRRNYASGPYCVQSCYFTGLGINPVWHEVSSISGIKSIKRAREIFTDECEYLGITP